jgi:hypothetical protein
VFVFGEIEVFQVKVFEFVSFIQAPQGIQNSEDEGTGCGCGVMPIGKGRRDISEGRIGLFWSLVEIKNRPATDEEGRVCSSLSMRARIINNCLVVEFGVMELAVEHLTESHQVTKVQWTEVKEEIPINQLCVGGEIMNGA